jgi:DNA-binding transcriptional LysR family regulator
MIDTKRLLYFVQIAEDGSLSKAAESLHVAQPALSRQIQILEDYLGFALFTRTRRGMQLTREGELLRNAVVGPLREVELAVENMRSFLSRAVFTIGIGIHPGLSPIIAKPLLQKIESDFPNVKFRIFEGPSSSQLDWLKRGMIDFSLTDQPLLDATLSDRELISEDIKLVGLKFNETVSGQVIKFKEMMKLSLVLPCQHMGVRKTIDDTAKQARASVNIYFETDSLPLTIELLKDGKCYALLPNSMAKLISAENNFSISSVDKPSLKISTYLITRSYGEIEGSLISRIDKTIEDIVVNSL